MALTLIVEPNPGGHRFQAVANVARLAGRTGEVTLLTSAGAAATDEFQVYLAGDDLGVDERMSGAFPTTRQFAQAIAAICRAQPVETVVVMDGDTALKTWWLIAARELRGLQPRPRVIFFLTRYPARLEFGDAADLGYWRLRVAKGALLLLARGTRTIDRAAGFAGRDDRARGWLVKRARDPATCGAHSRDRARLRAELGLPAERRLVGIFGGINVRKSPQLVLDAVLATGPDTDLVLAGPVNDEIRAWLLGLDEPRRRRVIVEDGFLSNERLDRYLAASDVVSLVMTLEGPSGIQGKAIAADVPIVTAGSKTRERELAAIGSGVATTMTVEGIADGLRRVLSGGASVAVPAAGRLELPTGETFAATVLGEPGPGRARIFAARVRNRLRHVGLGHYLRPVPLPDLVRLGSAYGGWWVPASAVGPGAVAYCGGAGEDITFDRALYERGAIVRTFDPTPRAIAHVEANAPAGDRFRFVPVGWWDTEAELEFYRPVHAEHVSHSAVNLFGTSVSFVAKVKPVHTLMAELGDDRVDIVKLDIEGAEHRVLDSLLADGPLPTVLCVEFDQPQPLRRIVARVRRLQRAGYALNKVEQWNYTFTRAAP